MAVTAESEQDAPLGDALLKRLTGGDRIKARRMRKDFFEFAPTHKLVMTGNYRPAVNAGDHGFWRRANVVPSSLVTHLVADT